MRIARLIDSAIFSSTKERKPGIFPHKECGFQGFFTYHVKGFLKAMLILNSLNINFNNKTFILFIMASEQK